jgi:DNA-binding NarL/FixJ family response regulator
VTAPPPIRVALADDHAMVRAGLRRLIEGEAGYAVVGEASDGAGALALLAEHPCDVFLMDLSMPPPNGAELITRILARWPATSLLVVSMHNSPRLARAALDAGALGFVTKDNDPEVLLWALQRVAAGERFIDPRIREAVLAEHAPASDPFAPLSPREREVMELLCAGLGNNDIARRLALSEKTVSTHKANILQKLGLSNLADLVRLRAAQDPEKLLP